VPHLGRVKRTRSDLELRGHGIVTRRYSGDQMEAASEAVAADLWVALLPDS
jgi:hypothetical protein